MAPTSDDADRLVARERPEAGSPVSSSPSSRTTNRCASFLESLTPLADYLRTYHPSLEPIEIIVRFQDGRVLQHPWPKLDPWEQEAAQCIHSEDYRSVVWFGVQYRFSAAQAAAVRLLWEAWQRGVPEVSGVTLLEASESAGGKVSGVFRDHPAWGTMIGQAGKGQYRLYTPDEN